MEYSTSCDIPKYCSDLWALWEAQECQLVYVGHTPSVLKNRHFVSSGHKLKAWPSCAARGQCLKYADSCSDVCRGSQLSGHLGTIGLSAWPLCLGRWWNGSCAKACGEQGNNFEQPTCCSTWLTNPSGLQGCDMSVHKERPRDVIYQIKPWFVVWTVRLIRNWLSGCIERVMVSGSETLLMDISDPQGSACWAVLFNIFINDIEGSSAPSANLQVDFMQENVVTGQGGIASS